MFRNLFAKSETNTAYAWRPAVDIRSGRVLCALSTFANS